jgi:hypothetical protein
MNLSSYYGVIIVGDFNYPKLEWLEGSGFSGSQQSEEHKFVSILLDTFFFQMVNTPTRGQNILDLICVNSPDLVINLKAGIEVADDGLKSDHYPVF